MWNQDHLPDRNLSVDPELTPAQIIALNSLNRALAKCRAAHLVLCGMDDTLLAYNGYKFDELNEQLPDAYEVQLALDQGGSPDAKVHAAGVYLESGGW
jgi:hypothetical protein